MTRKKCLLCFIGTLVIAVVLCAVAAATPRDYVYSDNGVYSAEIIRASDKILSGIDTGGYDDALKAVYNERERTEMYQKLLEKRQTGLYVFTEEESALLDEYSMSAGEAAARVRQLEYCEKRLKYAAGYPSYIGNIAKSVKDMSVLDIFDDIAKKNIIRTGADFYGLENITLDARQDEGVKLFLYSGFTDIAAVCAAVVCAVLCGIYCRGGAYASLRGNGFISLTVGFVVGIGLLYTASLFCSDMSLSLGDLARPAQSVTDFMTCSHIMSVGTLILLKIIFSAVACLVLYLLCVGVVSCRNRLVAAGIAVLLIADALFFAGGSRVGLFACFKAENVFGRYGNIMIFGEVFSPSALLTAFIALLLVISAVFASRAVRAASVRAAEQAEQAYFDEINERYTEARLIRHDISNHLSAVATLMDEGDYEGARRYLGDISCQLEQARPPVKTGSAVLDALLFRKVSDAKERRITTELQFGADLGKCGITDYDLCGVFSNLLDNAAEACEKLPPEDRTITLKVRRQHDMLCVFCENRCVGLDGKGALLTTKRDKSAHGFGLRRIERIAAKYKGSVDISVSDDIFAISVLLNQKNN